MVRDKLVSQRCKKVLLLNCDQNDIRKLLTDPNINMLKRLIGKHELVMIDEAQRILNIGLSLKLLTDQMKQLQLIVTGSSSLELSNQVNEPLTGRKITLKMYPLAQLELSNIQSRAQIDACLEERLIYGSYPEVILNKNNTKNITYLREIVNSYLYKDILELERIRYSDKITRLLQLLAFQIGKEVSYNELSTKLGMSKNTIERYLDLLEKSFVVFKLRGFSRNLRKEITKNPRFYFYDTGIRNALINNFNPLTMRDDLGMLWENYIIIERLKKQEYLNINSNNYFWRTYNQKEIDLVEEKKGKLFGYEIKWQSKKEKIPKEWKETYKNSNYQLITKENYLNFII